VSKCKIVRMYKNDEIFILGLKLETGLRRNICFRQEFDKSV